MKLQIKKGMYLGIENETYHADRTMVSKSWLDRVAVTPLHLRQYLDGAFTRTLALDIGSAVDCLVFEPHMFDRLFVKSPDAKKTTKDGRVEWADARFSAEETGRTIIEVHNTDYWTQIHQMAEAIQTNPLMKEFLKDGVGQAVFVTQDESTGLWVKCKTDHYHEQSGTIVDLKTAANASPAEFSRSIATYRYHVQDAFYSDIVKDVAGLDNVRFKFGVIEKPTKGSAPDPRMMAFYELTEREREAGRATYLSDLAAIAFAIDTGEWNGYADQVIEIERPAWARSRDQ